MANPYNTPEVMLRKFIERSYEGRFEDYDMKVVSTGKFSSPGHTSVYLGELLNSGYNGGFNIFNNSTVQCVVLPKAVNCGSSIFSNATRLETVDVGENMAGFDVYAFQKSTILSTIIMRRSTAIVTLKGSAFNNTVFASGGTGGTIYIPKALYDHLGDNSSLDYKAATNWSTWNGYGTITWAQIEGSQYEHYYADGTPIPTS